MMAPLNKTADDANQRDKFNRTPLHTSVYENKLPNVKELLQQGADLSLTSNNGNTPLHIAASRKYPHMIDVLLNYSSRDKVKECINAKITQTGNTALHVAANNGCVTIVRQLLSYGANFEVKNRAGKRPMNVATDPQVKNLLVSVEVDARLATAGKYLALESRMERYSEADLPATVYARNNTGFTSLQVAVAGNHANTVRAIVDARAGRLPESARDFAEMTEFVELGKKVSDNQSSLMLHSQRCRTSDGEIVSRDVAVILAGAYQIVAIADAATRPGDTRSKWLAVVEETLEVLEFEPAHVAYDEKGRVVFRGNDARYYKMLHIKDEGDVDSEHEGDFMAYMVILQLAVTKVIADFMCSIYTIQLNIAAKRNDFTLFEKCFEGQNIDVNVMDEDGRTPLHHAVDNGNEQMIKLLFKKKARIDCRTKANHKTALHLAAAKGHEKVADMLLRRENSMNLRMNFADAKTRDKEWSALHFAANAGHIKTMKILMRHGATYDLPANKGTSPRQWSKNSRAQEFLAKVDQMFTMSRDGNRDLLNRLCRLQSDELLAIGYTRNKEGQTLEKVADAEGHQDLAQSIAYVVRKETPEVKEETDEKDLGAAYCETESAQLLETLASSST